ncbi:histidine phosphatase family protein [Corynebacterium sp. AOP36-E1-14]|uniref:histidine phosphatase family protein n=1 Tax=unclassified Corynebacterium TaxID=2624378 RepID=UPI004034E99B
MPKNLILVRHGQSEANVIQRADKAGDQALFSEETMLVADRSWRLTDAGVAQAHAAGRWITDNVDPLDRCITSPYVRTRETAANLQLDGALWEENRVVRERSWGEISPLPRKVFEEQYAHNALLRRKDPLYWAPPAGESIANVAENRVRNMLSTLHRESSEDNVLVVTHGDFMWSTRLVLERWSDEEFLRCDKDKEMTIFNCTVLHYTRIDPDTGEIAPWMRWVRAAHPFCDRTTGVWRMVEQPWQRFDRDYLSNEDLAAVAEEQSRLLSE